MCLGVRVNSDLYRSHVGHGPGSGKAPCKSQIIQIITHMPGHLVGKDGFSLLPVFLFLKMCVAKGF